MKRLTFLVMLEKLGFTRGKETIGDDVREAMVREWSHGERVIVAAEDDIKHTNLTNTEDFAVIALDADREVITQITTNAEGAALDHALDACNAADTRLKGIVEYCGLLDISQDEREKLAGEALNAACRTIQRAIGQTDGGVAGQHFTGLVYNTIIDAMTSYIRLELDHMD